MLIISKHRDYYDSASVGIDKTIVYNRSTDVVSQIDKVGMHDDPKYDLRYASYAHYKWNRDRDYTMFVVGFCGVEYVGAALDMSIVYRNEVFRFTDGIYNMTGDARITYDQDEILSYFKPNKKYKHEVNKYNRMSDFMRRTHGKRNDDMFIKIGSPAYIVLPEWAAPKVLIKDPPLKDVDFMKVMDPFTAHQELEMYLGDVLKMREKDTVEISDEDRAASRGFDKTSFRRDKHPSKPRRKK